MKVEVDHAFNRSSINRPYFVGSFGGGVYGLSLSWGNRNSDPVWSIGLWIATRGRR